MKIGLSGGKKLKDGGKIYEKHEILLVSSTNCFQTLKIGFLQRKVIFAYLYFFQKLKIGLSGGKINEKHENLMIFAN